MLAFFCISTVNFPVESICTLLRTPSRFAESEGDKEAFFARAESCITRKVFNSKCKLELLAEGVCDLSEVSVALGDGKFDGRATTVPGESSFINLLRLGVVVRPQL